jgi:transcriptional regulator with XRE-family HTH domain
MYIEWLRTGLKRPGKSQRGLAKKLNVSESVVSRMLNGDRKLRADELDIIASYLGEPLPTSRTIVERRHLPAIQLTKIAAPGVWREQGAIVILDKKLIPSNPDPKYADFQQFAVLLEGSNRYAICIGHNPAHALQQGDLVLVERHSGPLVETTLRRVALTSNGVKLTLVSHQNDSPDVIHTIDDVDVIGRVTGFFEPA